MPKKHDFLFLPHTADIMFEAFGTSFSGALESAAQAIFDVVGKAQKPGEEIEILETGAKSRDELVVFVLSKIVSAIDAHELVPYDFKVSQFDEKSLALRGTLFLGKGTPRDHIKAVTFGNLEVQHKSRGAWRLQVLLDI
ncbi:archease [Candidatus Parvarchaeota archaeon]|nr:archease [Candidatus Parvarchaeota archaeon]